MSRNIDAELHVINNSVYGKDIKYAIQSAITINNDAIYNMIRLDYNARRINANAVWQYADANVISATQAAEIAGFRQET